MNKQQKQKYYALCDEIFMVLPNFRTAAIEAKIPKEEWETLYVQLNELIQYRNIDHLEFKYNQILIVINEFRNLLGAYIEAKELCHKIVNTRCNENGKSIYKTL